MTGHRGSAIFPTLERPTFPISPPRTAFPPHQVRGTMSHSPQHLLQGTLDLMILKALTWGPRHGYTVSSWIAARTAGGTGRRGDRPLRGPPRAGARRLARIRLGHVREQPPRLLLPPGPRRPARAPPPGAGLATVLGFITQPPVIGRILSHLRRQAPPARRARAPPPLDPGFGGLGLHTGWLRTPLGPDPDPARADGPAPQAPSTVHSTSRTLREPIEIPIPYSVTPWCGTYCLRAAILSFRSTEADARLTAQVVAELGEILETG